MSDALAAALLMGQRRRTDPLDQQRKYAQALMLQGSSTAPVQSPMEGLARALTGAAGGFFQGQANAQQDAKDRRTMEGLASVLSANTPDELQAAMRGISSEPGDMDIVGPIMANAIAEKQKQMGAARAADAFGNAWGAGAPSANPGMGGGQPGGLTIDINNPLPQGQVSASGFNNNTGNIRAGVGFPGEGPPQNGFATFGTPQQGVNAMVQNLGAYIKQNPSMTVAQAIAKWAPPNENNTQQYISQVAEGTGINPGMPLAEVMQDPAQAATLLDAITRKEKGGLPQGVSADTFVAATGGKTQGFQPTATAAQNTPGAVVNVAQGDNVPADGQVTQVGDSTSSGPPEVPRPQPTTEQLNRYRALIKSGMTPQQAEAGIMGELNKQWEADRARGLEVWKDQQQSKRQNEKAAIELGQKAPLETITKRIDNYENKIRPAAESASSAIANGHQARQLLDAGAITGTGTDAQMAFNKLKEMVGLDPNDKTANTQVLASTLANQVIAGMGGSLGQGVSNADVKFMQAAKAGEITWTEDSLRKLIDVNERASRRTLTNHDAESARIMKLPGMATMSEQYKLSPAPSYEEWAKANPPLGGSSASAASPKAQDNIPTLNSPAEAAKLPSGTQFRTPDGRLKVVP